MSIKREQMRIGGMTCINCQHKIMYTLNHTAGITKASVSYNTGLAEIAYDSDVITRKEIKEVIEKLDYKVLDERNQSEYDLGRCVSLMTVIVSLYVLLQHSGILNLLAPSQLADTRMGYGMIFIVGLITSVHCIAMCGGIGLSQCIAAQGAKKNGSESRFEVFLPSLLYNLGRVISYTAVGFLLGAAGMVLGGGSNAGLPVLFQGILKLIAGSCMVIMGMNMLGIFPWLRRFQLRMPKFIAVRIFKKKAAGGRPLMVGLLNGLMPCGPLQSMQIVALASGNPLTGALSMLLFSLGTVPLMLGLGSFVSALGRKFSQRIMGIGAVLVVVLGLAMMSQGGSLSGLLSPDRMLLLILMLSAVGIAASIPCEKQLYRAAVAAAVIALAAGGGFAGRSLQRNKGQKEAYAQAGETEIVDGVQVIHSTLSPGRYPTITVQTQIPVKWVIDAPAGSINGCNYKMLLKEYGIAHTFAEGENVIEFTPEKAGSVQYTCWMGMIRGNIFVTDGEKISSADAVRQPYDVPVPSGYRIPSDTLAVSQYSKDENGEPIQAVSIDLTENGFSPAVVVAEAGVPVIWTINNRLGGGRNTTEILVPVYASKLQLEAGENRLYLYPQESFEVSTGDHKFYAYVKIVDRLDQIDERREAEIRREADEFKTLIYPDIVFESPQMGCCGGY